MLIKIGQMIAIKFWLDGLKNFQEFHLITQLKIPLINLGVLRVTQFTLILQ